MSGSGPAHEQLAICEERRVLDQVPKQLYLAGRWRDGCEGTLGVEDPATGEVLCEVADASPADAREALDSGGAGWA